MPLFKMIVEFIVKLALIMWKKTSATRLMLFSWWVIVFQLIFDMFSWCSSIYQRVWVFSKMVFDKCWKFDWENSI